MYASASLPADAARVTEYGQVGQIPGAMFQHFTAMFESADAPDPHDVADAVLALIGAPKGNRAARVVVGASFGADVLNDATAPIQAGALGGLGLGYLETVAID